jgi:hypothetical protein
VVLSLFIGLMGRLEMMVHSAAAKLIELEV